MTDTRHLIGLLLGTENDWPSVFEQLVRRLGRVDGRRRDRSQLRRRADHRRAVRPALRAVVRPGDRPARLLVLPPARVAEEGRADGRRLPAQLAVHLPGDGEARRLLRHDAARPQGAGYRAGALQEPARPREVRVHRRAVQPHLRPRAGRCRGRLPAVHEAVRRRRLARRHQDPERRRAAPGLRRVRRDADAPAGLGRGVRRVRPVAVDRRRDDGDEVRPRPADARALLGLPRLPLPRDRRGGGVHRADRQRVLPLGVQLLRDPRRGHRGAPHRLRERVPGRRHHLAALLLPVGDEGAA